VEVSKTSVKMLEKLLLLLKKNALPFFCAIDIQRPIVIIFSSKQNAVGLGCPSERNYAVECHFTLKSLVIHKNYLDFPHVCRTAHSRPL